MMMEWEDSAGQLFNRFLESIVGPTRALAESSLMTAAERGCLERGGVKVAEADLIYAILRVTPQVFLEMAIKNLENIGVDCGEYLNNPLNTVRRKTDMDRLVDDLRILGERLDITYDEETLLERIAPFREFFESSPVAIKVTSSGALSVWYVDVVNPHPSDPMTIAERSGFIENDGHPMFGLFKEAMEIFDVTGYGVELNVSNGAHRFLMVNTPSSIESFFLLEHFPAGPRNSAQHLVKYGLDRFSLFGFDYGHKTIDIYFLVSELFRMSPEKCSELLREMNFCYVPPELIEFCANASVIQFSFSWETELAEWISFADIYPHRGHIPIHLHPMLRTCMQIPEFAKENTGFVFGVTISPESISYSLDDDYNDAMLESLSHAVRSREAFDTKSS